MASEEYPTWKKQLKRVAERMAKCDDCELMMIRNLGFDEGKLKATEEGAFKYVTDKYPRHPSVDDDATVGRLIGLGGSAGVSGKGSISLYLPSLLSLRLEDANRTRNTIADLFASAGAVLETIPIPMAQQADPLSIMADRKRHWCAFLFIIAFQNRRGVALRSEKDFEVTPAEFARQMKGEQLNPLCWSATINNALAGSIELIDLLIDDALLGIDDDKRPEPPATGAQQTNSWPTLTPAELRTLFDIEQDALVRRLKIQTIPNEKITFKAYRVDPSALPGGWKQTLNRQ